MIYATPTAYSTFTFQQIKMASSVFYNKPEEEAHNKTTRMEAKVDPK